MVHQLSEAPPAQGSLHPNGHPLVRQEFYRWQTTAVSMAVLANLQQHPTSRLAIRQNAQTGVTHTTAINHIGYSPMCKSCRHRTANPISRHCTPPSQKARKHVISQITLVKENTFNMSRPRHISQLMMPPCSESNPYVAPATSWQHAHHTPAHPHPPPTTPFQHTIGSMATSLHDCESAPITDIQKYFTMNSAYPSNSAIISRAS